MGFMGGEGLGFSGGAEGAEGGQRGEAKGGNCKVRDSRGVWRRVLRRVVGVKGSGVRVLVVGGRGLRVGWL